MRLQLLEADFRFLVSLSIYTAQFTAPYTHSELANMERQWATLANWATTMMQAYSLPLQLLGSCVAYRGLPSEHTPTLASSGGPGGVPFIFLHGVPTDNSHLKVFGFCAYLHLEDHYREKPSPKAL
jgi:hypothetical protein